MIEKVGDEKADCFTREGEESDSFGETCDLTAEVGAFDKAGE